MTTSTLPAEENNEFEANSAGSKKSGAFRVCPNCSLEFRAASNYCANCGQANKTHKRPVIHFVREFVEDLFNLDARLFVTFRDLVAKPGLLTKNYNSDQRARYTSPLKFYVIASLLFFFTINWLTRSGVETANLEFQEAMTQSDSLWTDTDIKMFSLSLDGEELGALSQIIPPDRSRVDSVLVAHGKEVGWFEMRLLMSFMPILVGQFSVSEYVAKLIRNFSYSLFVLMPVFAFILKVLYVRRHQYYTEHLIFAIHLHTFAFLVLTLGLWADQMQKIIPVQLLMFSGVLVYQVLAMRVVYEQGWMKTVVKSILANNIYFFVFLSVSLIVFLWSLF